MIAFLAGCGSVTCMHGMLEERIQRIAQNQDRVAFAEVYREVSPRIRAFLRRGGAEGEVVEELLQEIMLTIWRKADTFNPSRGNANTWVFTIARNRRIDHYRRRKWPQVDPEDPVLVPDTAPSLESRVAREQQAKRLRAALDRLPPDLAQVIREVYLQGKLQKTVAADHNIPVGTVKSRIRRALARLQAEGVTP